VQDRSGQAVLLAFHYFDQTRQFRGELSDPMPVGWEHGELKVMTGTGRRRGRRRRGSPDGGRGGAR
jgi:hypothetical protein